MQQTIDLHIDELVLHGFSAHHAANLGEALQQELTRLLQEQGLPAGLSADVTIGRLNAGTFMLQPDAKPEVAGTTIATSVYKGFQHESYGLRTNGK